MTGFVDNSRIKHFHIAPALHVTVSQSFQATVGRTHSYRPNLKKDRTFWPWFVTMLLYSLFSTFLPPYISCKIRPTVKIDPPLPRWTPGAPA